MAVQRMDHVSIVVDDLEAAIAFFLELGLELEARRPSKDMLSIVSTVSTMYGPISP